MSKTRTIYTCQSCGSFSHKWLGRCPDCDSWNTFVEEMAPDKGRGGAVAVGTYARVTAITTLDMAEEYRVATGIGELDRVLGGGVVPGSAVLIGGDPGIGKSTLLLQAASRLAERAGRILYVTGEESGRQIRLRAERLGALSDRLLVYAETSVERIIEALKTSEAAAVIIDSVQTVHTAEFESSPGSVSQVRESAARLIGAAKALEVPLFLVGHVTKEGAIAGPKVLEHMVDTVLYFEGESGHPFRVLRAAKNRFGSVMEIGVFEMKDTGLAEVANPSEIFLAERPAGASGSAVSASVEGTRTLLVEVQSLVCPTVFGMPRRTVSGVDYNKVVLLAAVLEKKAGINLSSHDIFLKVAGGIRIDEPAIDLGITASMASNFKDAPVDPKTVVFGEVGLAGEIRAVTQAEKRVREAAKLGFTRCILPKDSVKGIAAPRGFKLDGVSTVSEAIKRLF